MWLPMFGSKKTQSIPKQMFQAGTFEDRAH
jgi:hypothetical protein